MVAIMPETDREPELATAKRHGPADGRLYVAQAVVVSGERMKRLNRLQADVRYRTSARRRYCAYSRERGLSVRGGTRPPSIPAQQQPPGACVEGAVVLSGSPTDRHCVDRRQTLLSVSDIFKRQIREEYDWRLEKTSYPPRIKTRIGCENARMQQPAKSNS